MAKRLPYEDESREFDLVIYGATGFTGQLAAEHMYTHYLTKDGKAHGARFALAARSLRKLEELRDRLSKHLNKSLDSVPLLVVDSNDRDSLIRMCGRTRVVATAVGPFLTQGEPLVAACVDCVTHYCDLTAELPFVEKVYRVYGRRAAEQGLKMVHMCGWVAVASDLSCLLLEETSLKLCQQPCEEVKSAITRLYGGISWGTLASAENLIDDPSFADTYYLCTHAMPRQLGYTPAAKHPPKQGKNYVAYDKDFGYNGFYLGGSLDEATVRWTNALRGNMYGKDFNYSVVLAPEKAGRISIFLTSLLTYIGMYLFRFKAVRSLLSALRILPQPGQGPSRNTLENGYYKMRTVGRTRTDKRGSKDRNMMRMEVTFAGEGDPGYYSAAKMLCEVALCMAKQMDECTELCGVLSPAAGIGSVLRHRLQASGIKIDVNVTEEGD